MTTSGEAAADVVGDSVDELCFTARALAQTHPMTVPALRYRQRRFEQERARQPVPEIADWASTGLLVGYCLRRAEEAATGRIVVVDGLALGEYPRAAAIATSLLTGDEPDCGTLLPAGCVLAALDRLIASELGKREEHVREQLDLDAWAELETYVAWWILHGYAVRTAEAAG